MPPDPLRMLVLRTSHTAQQGRLDSVDWNGGMDWNGMVEWTGMVDWNGMVEWNNTLVISIVGHLFIKTTF